MTNFGGLNNANTDTETPFSAFDGAVCSTAAFPEDGTLNSVSVYWRRQYTGYGIRMALYTGGTSDDDPNGATLVWDSGAITYAELPSANGWHTENAGGEALSAGARLWFAVKGSFGGRIFSVTGADRGDLNPGTTGNCLHAVGLGEEENDAFPSSIGATGPTVFGSGAWKFRLDYTAAAGGTPATANPTTAAATGAAGSLTVETRPGPPYTLMTVTG